MVAATRSPCNGTTVVFPDLSIAASAIRRRCGKNSATRLEVELLTGDGDVDHQPTAWNHEHRDAIAERRRSRRTVCNCDRRGTGAQVVRVIHHALEREVIAEHDQLRERLAARLRTERKLTESQV